MSDSEIFDSGFNAGTANAKSGKIIENPFKERGITSIYHARWYYAYKLGFLSAGGEKYWKGKPNEGL
jgi:hypothetical protein